LLISSIACEDLRLRSKRIPDHNRHGIRLESYFGHIAVFVILGRTLLELNHRYGKPKKLRTKE